MVLSLVWVVICCDPPPKKVKIVRGTVRYIVVRYQGDSTTSSEKRITNKDTIANVCRLLIGAREVSFQDIDAHPVKYARLSFHQNNDYIDEMMYSSTFRDGNIIWYHGSYFRCDSLELYLK